MNRKPDPPDVKGLTDWDRQSAFEKNRRVLEWLSHDARRADLFKAIRDLRRGVLKVPSRARHDEYDGAAPAEGAEAPPHSVYLIADPRLIEMAFRASGFSNKPYRRIGTGEFMLGLDPQDGKRTPEHACQRLALNGGLHRAITRTQLATVARWSSRAACTTLLGVRRTDVASRAFDLAALAEHAALRMAQVLFGFARNDLRLLSESMPKVYRGMLMQMYARHFVSDPPAVREGRAALGRLAGRAAELMHEYAWRSPKWPEGCEEWSDDLPEFTPVLKHFAVGSSPPPRDLGAVVVVGALAGMVGNIQAASCIALRHLLDPANALALTAARGAAHRDEDLWEHVVPALRRNPPAAFLPRINTQERLGLIPAGADCILCVGSATNGPGAGDDLMFGDLGRDEALHHCIGARLTRAIVPRIVGDVLRLADVEEALDVTDGLPIGLEKRWGYACDRYPLVYRRDRRVWQQPLNVSMRVRAPVDENGERIRAIIRAGAPRIERLLREARHVHFAWFQLVEDGHALVLHTVFDGDFEAYLHHFAQVAGELFDDLFKYLEGAPPVPVKEHPEAFVRAILAHHQAPAEGYFFSAYPKDPAPQIQAALARRA